MQIPAESSSKASGKIAKRLKLFAAAVGCLITGFVCVYFIAGTNTPTWVVCVVISPFVCGFVHFKWKFRETFR
jgi:hypothetical protein